VEWWYAMKAVRMNLSSFGCEVPSCLDLEEFRREWEGRFVKLWC
jgi:hypothetical protein